MQNLPIDSLRALVTTAELGSVTATAERLGRSQPAISLQIKKLEQILGRELFLRGTRLMQLSSDGLEVYRSAQQILELNDALLREYQTDPLSGQVRLGIPSEFATTLLPKMVGRFAKAYPGVRLEVFSDLSRNLRNRQQRGEFDLILALHDRASPRRRGLLKTDELVWVGGSGQLADQRRTLPLVVAQDGCLYRERALRKLEAAQIAWRIAYTNPDLAGIQTAIKEGLGITVLARSTVPKDLVIISRYSSGEPLPELGSIDISLQYRSREASDATRHLARHLQSSLDENA